MSDCFALLCVGGGSGGGALVVIEALPWIGLGCVAVYKVM